MLSPASPPTEPSNLGLVLGTLTQTPSSTPEGPSLVNVGARTEAWPADQGLPRGE